MTIRSALTGLATLVLGSAFGGEGVFSDPIRVFTRTDDSFFWRTAFGTSLTLAWEFPEGVASADVSVVGRRFSKTWTDLTGTSLEIELPDVESAADEDVYEMTISFGADDVRVARIGLVRGAGADEGATRVVADETSRKWSRFVGDMAVLPIPQGAATISIDGQSYDTGLGGAQGWFAWGPLEGSFTSELAFASESGPLAATLTHVPGGLLLLFR